MSDLDDTVFSAQLARRSRSIGLEAERDRDARLWAAVMARLPDHPQERRWHLGVTGMSVGRAPAVALVALAVVVGLVELGTGLGSLQPTPDAFSVQVLSADQLASLAGLEHGAANAGRLVVVDAELSSVPGPACLPKPECRLGFFASSTRQIFLRAGETFGQEVDLSPPLAVRIHGVQEVDLVGHVRLGAEPSRIWTIGGVIDDGPGPAPALYPVDAWLTTVALPPSCPARIDESGSLLAWGPFGCGDAAWLGPDDTQPNVVTVSSESTSYSFNLPADGIRVQNGAYGLYARTPFQAVVDASIVPPPQRATYLVRSPVDAGVDCFVCPSSLATEIVARLDPVTMPESPPPSPQDETPPAIGRVSIRTILDDPSWAGDPVPTDDVMLCIGGSDCGSTGTLYPGVSVPIEDVDFSTETMLRVVNGVPRSVTWDGTVLEIQVARHATGFWEGAIGIDLGDVPGYELRVLYIICARASGRCERT